LNAYPDRDVEAIFGLCASTTTVEAGYERIMTLDTLVAGVHFPVSTIARDMGYKSVAVNLSDLAAMGAEPRWLYLSLSIPEWDVKWLQSFWQGMQALMSETRLATVVVQQGALAISIEAHGVVPVGQAILRSGAKINDAVYVTGTLGDAGCGLQQPDAGSYLLQRLNRPTPRVETGTCLRGIANAMIDISDGLLADAGHVAAASEVSIHIDQDCVPVSENLLQCVGPELARQYALSAGDDYELCFTVPEEKAPVLTRCMTTVDTGFTRIGTVKAGSGVQLLDSNGTQVAHPGRGYDHFE